MKISIQDCHKGNPAAKVRNFIRSHKKIQHPDSNSGCRLLAAWSISFPMKIVKLDSGIPKSAIWDNIWQKNSQIKSAVTLTGCCTETYDSQKCVAYMANLSTLTRTHKFIILLFQLFISCRDISDFFTLSLPLHPYPRVKPFGPFIILIYTTLI